MNKKYLIPLFLIMVLAQLYVPGKMIFDEESIIQKGTSYLFELEPVDPTDFFRGKYITLGFKENKKFIDTIGIFSEGRTVYAMLSNNKKGIVKIDSLTLFPPDNAIPYFTTTISYSTRWGKDSTTVYIEFPFNRFYMEESKAPLAEIEYNQVARTDTIAALGKVYIFEGKTVLTDVLIGDTPIGEWVEIRRDSIENQ